MSVPNPIIFSNLSAATSSPNTPEKSMLVVGAGIAGLTACKVLLEKDYKVTLLEAQSKAGGRIAVQRMGNSLIPTGAMYIHDPNSNAILSFIDKNNRKEISPLDMPGLKIRSKAIASQEDLTKLFTYYAEYKSNMRPGRLETLSPEENKDDLKRIAFKLAQDTYVSYRGVSYTELQAVQQQERMVLDALFQNSSLASASSTATDAGYEGDLFVSCPGGYYKALIEPLLNELIKSPNFEVRFNTPVREIDCRKDPATVTTPQGEIFKADGIICAIPVAVIQKNQILIHGLDQNKKAAIDHLKLCLQNQITLEFDNLDWMETAKEAASLNLIEECEGSPTLIHGQNLYRTMADNPSVLKFSLYAEHADFTGKSDLDVKNHLMGILKSHFGNAVPEPKSFHITRWNEDRYVSQSWSRPGALTTPQEVAALQSLNSTGNLCLAGEYTAGIGGDVHAAYLSGFNAADTLAQQLTPKGPAKIKVGQ